MRRNLVDAETANDPYIEARPGCVLSTSFPMESMNYSAFGATHRPTSEIGAKTLTATLRSAIPAPSYPWAAQGGATMRAVVILVRKPSAGSR